MDQENTDEMEKENEVIEVEVLEECHNTKNTSKRKRKLQQFGISLKCFH